MIRRMTIKLALLMSVSMVAGIASASAAPTVTTSQGTLQGNTNGSVNTFLGVPFAAPPVGALRWRPPAAAPSWSGIRQATSFGGICPQVEIFAGFNTPSTNEDCLYLNVFTPANATAESKLPVMFWIYGGGFAGGESNDYDGSKLAKQGNVIVVTINYRVGVLGNLAHPALAKEGALHTNYGILDQQAALSWVRQNISAFGGDPKRVTIFGESAGAVSVYVQLISPLVKGLFNNAIAESGSFGGLFMSVPEADAEVAGESFAAQVGCTDQTAACLRSLPVETILANQGSVSAQPVQDGTILPLSIDTAFRTGQFTHVPLIDGNNHDELRWSVAFGYDVSGQPATAATYQQYLLSTFGTQAATVAAKYPLSAYQSPDVALATIQTDQGVSCPGVFLHDWMADATTTYTYEFDDITAPTYLPPVSFNVAAGHTTEIQYLFPLYHGGEGVEHTLNPQQEQLSDRMVDYWTHFAYTGAPGGTWQPYTRQDRSVQALLLRKPMPTSTFPREHSCAFWTKLEDWPSPL